MLTPTVRENVYRQDLEMLASTCNTHGYAVYTDSIVKNDQLGLILIIFDTINLVRGLWDLLFFF